MDGAGFAGWLKILGGWSAVAAGLLLGTIALLIIGRGIFVLIYPGCNIRKELVEKDNLALALTLAGYILGLAIALGGSLIGPSLTVKQTFYDLLIYGPLALFMMILSHIINDRVILRHFDNKKEIIEDQNSGTGIVVAGNHVAMGLVVFGALSGEGSLVTALVFWLLGQLALVLVTLFYNAILPFDLHKEIERDNVAVGVAFSGVLVATGNIVRYAIQGDFVSWEQDLIFFGGVMVFGAIALPLARFVVDKFILIGRNLTDELVNQEKPNIGAGAIEAIVYVALSFLIGWSLH
ncbi:DUF350 domain-containing protein [Thermodesulforhabdus norvegica]|uniref:Uncharacterized membrane protein YjfL, UPF0719 family n=1 Tax=Thermodesulforhabdus norvegica TaxID=39841 RepID=A0A1I4QTQ9_9BACT|nr:DUF350 domain-containing protein [Thermodesulforhabdus norvegica]SFM43462.1 Uncharacterized membrane protein YjfL, UPF0719 family [Thermodesulforhabdus norvegica]